jgi:hypothetical protein
MILPIVTAVSREVIAVVPRDLREAALALGATRYESVRLAVLPYARSGIVGASMLGLGRALGETIAVSLVVGNTPRIGWSLMQPGATIPSWIASSFREATSVGLHRSALLALAVTLVIVAFVLAVLSRLLVRRTADLVGGPSADEVVTEGIYRGRDERRRRYRLARPRAGIVAPRTWGSRCSCGRAPCSRSSAHLDRVYVVSKGVGACR